MTNPEQIAGWSDRRGVAPYAAGLMRRWREQLADVDASGARGIPLRAVAAILWIASLLISRPGVYVHNHAVEVPLVRWLADPSLYPGDPFVAALAHYPSGLWQLVALASRVIPLGPLLLILLALSRLLSIVAAGRLALAFAPRSRLAATASMALFAFVISPFLGVGTIVESYFEQTGLAVALLLLATAAFHEQRRLACAVWLGVALNINIMYTIFALSYLGLAFLLDPEYRKVWRSWVPAAALFAGLASYMLFFVLSSVGASHTDDSLWLEATRARCWRHLYPADWNWSGYALTALLAALVLAVVHDRFGVHERVGRHAIVWTCGAAFWLATSFTAAYLFEWPPLLMLQPARALDLWVCFSAIAILSSGMMVAVGGVFALWTPPGWPAVAGLAIPFVRRRAVLFLSIWVVIAGVFQFANRVVPAADLLSAVVAHPGGSVEQIAAWARTNTDKDSVFLINLCDVPNWDSFRGLSERSIYTNWEEGTAIYWDRAFVTEWMRRLTDIGFDRRRLGKPEPEETLCRLYEALRDDDVRMLERKYGLRYWVVPWNHPSDFPTAFERDGYKVLDLTPGMAASSSAVEHAPAEP